MTWPVSSNKERQDQDVRPALVRPRRAYPPQLIAKPTWATAQFSVLQRRVGSFDYAWQLRQIQTLFVRGYDTRDISIALHKTEPQVCRLLEAARGIGLSLRAEARG